MSTLTVDLTGNYTEGVKFLRAICRGNRGAMANAGRVLAKREAGSVQRRYAAGTAPPLSLQAQEKRVKGKRAGGPGSTTPEAVPPYPGVTPLHRSGALAAAVEWARVGDLNYVVRIKPGSVGPQGQDLAGITFAQEHGFVTTITMTRRQQVYLMILAGTIPEPKGGGTLEDGSRPIRDLVINVPARPVWGYVWDRDLPYMTKAYLRAWGAAMQYHLRSMGYTGATMQFKEG